jgi:putative transposase
MTPPERYTSKKKTGHHRIAPTIQSSTIGSIIGQFKSIVTKRINKIHAPPGVPVWQHNYYEHIIRDDRELHAIREYIRYNPLKWDEDEENSNMKCRGNS